MKAGRFVFAMAAALLLWGCNGGPTTSAGNPLAQGEVSVDEIRDLPARREIDLRWGNGGATLSGTLYLPVGRGPFRSS